ncbi:hypothetical protein [Eubacterium callanderi]|nr:hypothetical protein [Eubacterium callanderi]MCQ4823073.1 hypothetical protein [Eubacterium callanderi]
MEKFDIEYDAEVISAHRNPDKIFSYVRSAEENSVFARQCLRNLNQ